LAYHRARCAMHDGATENLWRRLSNFAYYFLGRSRGELAEGRPG
jgi:hypothetical protein